MALVCFKFGVALSWRLSYLCTASTDATMYDGCAADHIATEIPQAFSFRFAYYK